MYQDLIRSELNEAADTLANFLKDDSNIKAIASAAVLLADSFKAGGKVLSCGNGGSHCDAMHFAEELDASVIIRGLRAVADFEYEYQMAGMNQQINSRVETVFLMADVSLQPIASRLVKEIALYGGPIHKFVSPAVREEVEARVAALGLKGQG